jgi:hypothetical protein
MAIALMGLAIVILLSAIGAFHSTGIVADLP